MTCGCPTVAGPHPVVVLVHGGCWLSAYGLDYMGAMADALAEAGIASWSIEFRRIGSAGGGWPGTMQDVGAAIDHLRVLATSHPLDLTRVALSGHSAGGHLVLLGGGTRQAAGVESAAFRRSTFRCVASWRWRRSPTWRCRSRRSVRSATAVPRSCWVGARQKWRTATRWPRPLQLLPLGVPYVIVNGEQDPIVPVAHVTAFAEAARKAGDQVRLEIVPASGHFEPVAPGKAAFAVTLAAIVEMVSR